MRFSRQNPHEQYNESLASLANLSEGASFATTLRECVSWGKKLPSALREQESKQLWTALSGNLTCDLINRLEQSAKAPKSNLDGKYTALSQFARSNFCLDESLKHRALVSAELLPKVFRYDAFIKANGEVTGFAGYHGGYTTKPYLPRDVAEAVVGLQKSVLDHLKQSGNGEILRNLFMSNEPRVVSHLRETLKRSQDSWESHPSKPGQLHVFEQEHWNAVDLSPEIVTVQPTNDQSLYEALKSLEPNNETHFDSHKEAVLSLKKGSYAITQGEGEWSIDQTTNKAAFKACFERLPDIKGRAGDSSWLGRYSATDPQNWKASPESKYYWLAKKTKASNLWFQVATPVADKVMNRQVPDSSPPIVKPSRQGNNPFFHSGHSGR